MIKALTEEQWSAVKKYEKNKRGEWPKCGFLVREFRHDGVWIENPYLSVCGRFEVDPEEYYGIKIIEEQADDGE